MLIFLIIYGNDNDSEQVGTTLYPIIKAVFGNMHFIWSNAIIVDKDKTERNAIIKVIKVVFVGKMKKLGDPNKISISSMLVLCKNSLDRVLITKGA